MESTYVRRVERAHGLPRGQRQLTGRVEKGVIYRDVLYEAYRTVVELDGRIGHELDADRWDDMDRDLDTALEDVLTIRLGWRHAEHRPCLTARKLGRLFSRRGWRADVHPCRPNCAITQTIGVVS